MTQHGDTADRNSADAGSDPAVTALGETRDGQPPLRGEPAPEPQFPSPYLEGGASVPEAYPAPPQPGMPSFGSAGVPPWAGQSQAGGPQAGGPQYFHQQAPRQPFGYRQPGQPGTTGRPAFGVGQRAQRDPALAAGWERLLAATLDWLMILAVSLLVFLPPMLRVWHRLEAITNSYPNLGSAGAQAAIDSFARSPATVGTLLHFWLAVLGIALVYYWVMHVAWGATLGKRLLGVAVVTAAGRSRIGARAAGIRTVAYLAGPAIFVLIGPIEILGGILWLSDNGLVLLDRQGQSIHDRLAGTVVVSRRRVS
jgi:uncharacterized RDD family membrane protein YckC